MGWGGRGGGGDESPDSIVGPAGSHGVSFCRVCAHFLGTPWHSGPAWNHRTGAPPFTPPPRAFLPNILHSPSSPSPPSPLPKPQTPNPLSSPLLPSPPPPPPPPTPHPPTHPPTTVSVRRAALQLARTVRGLTLRLADPQHTPTRGAGERGARGEEGRYQPKLN